MLSTSASAGSSVGTYPVTQGTLSAGPNYAISYNAGTLTVTAAALTVTANNLSKVYGAALPALTYTYSGLVNGDTAAVLSGHALDVRPRRSRVSAPTPSPRARSPPARTTRSATTPAR